MKNLFAAILIVACTFGCKRNSDSDYLIIQLELLQNENDSIRKQNILLSQNADSLQTYIKSNVDYWFDEDFDNMEYPENIKDPREFMDSSLRSQPELIPIEGTLGGTMHYGRTLLLGRHWILADYNDGHYSGKALFHYKFNENNELEFNLIQSIIN